MSNEYKPRRIHIIIQDEETNINLKLPFFLTKALLNMISMAMEISYSSMDEKSQMAMDLGVAVLRIIQDIRINGPLEIVHIEDEGSNVLIKLL